MQLIHSSADGHLDCFQFGSILNKAVRNILVTHAFISLELLDHRVSMCLVLQESSRPFSDLSMPF